MITLKLTRTQADDILHAVGQMYLDYDEYANQAWNDSIRRYNNQIDELRQTIKDQLKEQE